MPTALVWFRNDLRITDNEALTRAAETADEVLPIFCFDPRWFRQNEIGLNKSGAFRFRFLKESVEDLRREIEKLGAKLVIRIGRPEDIIPEVVREHRIAAVWTSKEITEEELSVEKKLRARLQKENTELHCCWQSTLVHRDDLPFEIDELPDVYTHFRKKVEKGGLDVRELFAAPERLVSPDVPTEHLPDYATFGLEEPPKDARAALHFRGGARAGWARVDHYFWNTDCLSRYKETRNGLLGADYSSKFSPWLAHGCFSPRQLYYEIRDYEAERTRNKSTYWLIFELLWRDYFKFVGLKFGNRLFQWGGIRQESLDLRNDETLFRKWAEGETGNPFVDANMRELKQSGFMSNRGRQNVASFLVKDLRLNWQWGAMYFESLLIDYDVTSNWGNWCYVAGIGNDPRNDRYFNTRVQAERYDKKGEYIRHWLPELTPLPNRYIHWPGDLHAGEQEKYGVKLGADYPHPVVSVRAPKKR